MFRYQQRFKRCVAVAGHLDRDGASVGIDRLFVRAVAVVPRPPPRRVAFLVAEMVSHLHLEAPRQDPRRQLGQDPVGTQQFKALRIHLSHQTIHKFVIDHRTYRLVHRLTISSRHRQCPLCCNQPAQHHSSDTSHKVFNRPTAVGFTRRNLF